MLRAGKANGIVLFLLFLVIAGGGVAFVVFGGAHLTKQGADEKDQAVVDKINQIYAGSAKAEAKAKLIESQLATLHGESVIAEQNVKLADLYDQVGLEKGKSTEPGAIQEAENALTRAVGLDASNPKIMADLGELYSKFAKQQISLDDKKMGYDKSTDWLKKSIAASKSDTRAQTGYAEKAGEIYFSEATEFANATKYDVADQAIKDGLRVAPQGSGIHKQLLTLQGQMSTYKKT